MRQPANNRAPYLTAALAMSLILASCMSFNEPEGDIHTGSKLGVSIGDDTRQIDAKMKQERFDEKSVAVCDDKNKSHLKCEPGDEVWTYHRHYATVTTDEVHFKLRNGIVRSITWSANQIEVP